MKRLILAALLFGFAIQGHSAEAMKVSVKTAPVKEIKRVCRGDACTVVASRDVCTVYLPPKASKTLVRKAVRRCVVRS